MTDSSRPIIVVEDDPFPRLIQVILDPSTPADRITAFSHFMAHDLADLAGWCERLRARVGNLYPAEVRLARDEAGLRASLRGARAVVVEAFEIGEKEIAAAGGTLKLVQKYGAIASRIDLAACRRASVRVITIRRRANIATAEHAFALMLALARKLAATANLISVEQLRAAGYAPTSYVRAHTANGNWARVGELRNLHGRQLGIMGLGEIGRELALRAAAFGMRIIYNQRHRLSDDEERRYQATYASLDDLLASSDYVSLHLPGGAATRGIIGPRELALVKPGALWVNVSQPQLIDRTALMDTLAAGRLGGLGVDTWYEEPGRADDPVLNFPNVIITPHLGASPRFNSLDDLEEVVLNVARALDGSVRGT